MDAAGAVPVQVLLLLGGVGHVALRVQVHVAVPGTSHVQQLGARVQPRMSMVLLITGWLACHPVHACPVHPWQQVSV